MLDTQIRLILHSAGRIIQFIRNTWIFFFWYTKLQCVILFSCYPTKFLKHKGIQCTTIFHATVGPQTTEVSNHRLKPQKCWALSLLIDFWHFVKLIQSWCTLMTSKLSGSSFPLGSYAIEFPFQTVTVKRPFSSLYYDNSKPKLLSNNTTSKRCSRTLRQVSHRIFVNTTLCPLYFTALSHPCSHLKS